VTTPDDTRRANRQALVGIVLVLAVIAVVAVVAYVSNIEAGGNGVSPPTTTTSTTLRTLPDQPVTYRGRVLHCAQLDPNSALEDYDCDFVRFYMENTDIVPTTTTTSTP